ncbi:MAG: adenosylcobinamide-GDP ribazoletransferase [Pseudomonadota bacterium]
MAKTDRLLNDLLIAFHLLTRLPLPPANWGNSERPSASAAWAYPLVGVVLGGLAAVVAWLALWAGLSAALAAGVFLGAMALMSGAMHEDGLADCADGFWGGWERDRRLDIMKDSQIGTYGVLALSIIVGLKWIVLTHILENASLWVLLTAPVLSRAAMVTVMAALPHAREGGLSHSTGKPDRVATYTAFALGMLAAFSMGIGTGIVLLLIAGAATLALAAFAKAKIGGQTGDVLGAVQCVTEACLLLTLSTVIA